eukprot:TRINITY_DN35913_c0_g1_i1.p2 TRINITY_DN35913_c0_g1~~TRINITY_DN35913_c0_g1_i1.p2  ORF type:complete len:401 (+),score=100.02 TRINITY_DN35913_c0_g1_i1:64-1266(+)
MAVPLVPRILHVGGGCSVKMLGETLAALGVKRPLLVTDPYMAKTGSVDKLLSKAGMKVEVYADVVPDPTVACVKEAAEVAVRGQHDAVIGFGGGSPMDTAKAVAVVAGVDGGIDKLPSWKAPQKPPQGLPIICIPTTSGTGSEATRVTIITNETVGPDGEPEAEKMLLLGDSLQPVAALVDYEWTMSMPFRLSADTGIDALCHCIEAYTSRKSNSFSELKALEGIALISKNLRTACFQLDNKEAREKMAMGSMLGGMSFSNASVHMVHGMSRPVGAHFKVPHGLSNAMLLPAVTRYLTDSPEDAAVPRFAKVGHTMGAKEEWKAADACAWLRDELAELNTVLKVPTPKEFIGEGRHDEWLAKREVMVEQAVASGSPGNSPRVPTKDKMMDIYSSMWASVA